MKVIFSRNLGYCQGVKRAIELAEKNLPGVCTLGELTHNEQVIRSLEQKGIYATDIDNINADKVVIRSHGIGKAETQKLESLGKQIIDATCPFVRKIHEIVRDHFERGFTIVIVGDRNHPEVKGINGWCEDSAVIIDPDGEINGLDEAKTICLVLSLIHISEPTRRS